MRPPSNAAVIFLRPTDDLDYLRSDPALKLACGHLPDSGRDLCSQPTMLRYENAPSLREVIRLMRAMVAVYCRNYDKLPASVTLDIDDTLDARGRTCSYTM